MKVAPMDRFTEAVQVAVIEAMAEQDVTYAQLSRALEINSGTVWQRINDPSMGGHWTLDEVAELKRTLDFRWPDMD